MMSAYRGGKGNKNYTGIPEEKQDEAIDLSFSPSTLETVDYAIYDYLSDTLSLKTSTNEGTKKVPIVWASAERAFQIKITKNLETGKELLFCPP